MNGLAQHLAISLRLHARNRMALIYGYVFPLIFLIAFWVLYRHERVPLLRHMGELLTVSVLGGACFGLPTTLVSDRERGVWRRYRLAPVPTWAIVASTVVARYLIILSAGLLQFGVALAIGMTMPEHPLGLLVTFTAVSFAFIGLGLVIAMMADNVPAVQALGQCIFLPMLIIGGVAVQLGTLPVWAQHVSAFFPGRYAVEAIQACVTGRGLEGARFSLLALGLIGVAGCVAGAKLFRWDAQQRFLARGGKGWLAVALGAWLTVGLLAEWRGRIAVPVDAELKPAAQPTLPTPTLAPQTAPPSPPANAPSSAPVAVAPSSPAAPASVPTPTLAPVADATPAPAWTKVTDADVMQLDFRVPPDEGVVSPFAPPDDQPDEFIGLMLLTVKDELPKWKPAHTPDDLTNVRNLLFACAVPDAIQLPVERYMPGLILEELIARYPKPKLVQMLTWIVTHPEEGEVITDISELGIDGQAGDTYTVRERTYYYALKFILRLTEPPPEKPLTR